MKSSAKVVLGKIFIFGGPLILFLFLAILLFWRALFTDTGALQWDALEVHLTNLIFSSSVWHQGFWPLWTPYIFNGYPQIADLQVAVFYPINLLVGIFFIFSQKIIFWQLVFHYALSGFGMFLLARYLTKDTLIGVFAGIAYMFSGFMIGHASHLGMQNTATWLPIVFLLATISLRERSWRNAVFAGLVSGVMILSGHFQMSVFAFFALGFYFLFYFLNVWRIDKKPPFYQITLWAIIALMAFLISATQLLPTFELAKQSQRASISLDVAQTESLNPDSLRSIVINNYNNVSRGEYRGPWDRTQNNLFLGKIVILLAVLAVVLYFLSAINFLNKKKTYIEAPALFLIILAGTALLYSLGQYGFLHRYFYLLPLFNKMRAPSNMMILFDFAVILLSALGLYSLKTLQSKYFKTIILVAIVLVFLELFPQAVSSELLYARKNPAIIFKKPEIVNRILYEYDQLSPINQFKSYRVPELDRNLTQVFKIYDFGGYNPLALRHQGEYEDAMARNPLLIDLAGIKYLPCEFIASRAGSLEKIGNLCVNEQYRPKAFLTDQYRVIQKEQLGDALRKLRDGNILLLEEDPFIKPDPARLKGVVEILPTQNPDKIEFLARTDKDALLFVSQTYYPGWRVLIDGKEEKILRANHLFQAVALKEGEHRVSFSFSSPALKSGIFLSIIGVIIVLSAGASFLFKR